MKSQKAIVHFADIAVSRLEPDRTLPNKFRRMLKKFSLPERVQGKSVGIKMHYGGGTGYSTIPPVFVRILVEALKVAEASMIKVMDNNPEDGVARGYTKEVLGCEVASTFGASRMYVYREEIGFMGVD